MRKTVLAALIAAAPALLAASGGTTISGDYVEARTAEVMAGEASLDVATRMDHSPTCGAIQWYEPLAAMTQSTLGHTTSEAWSGSALGTQWSMGDKRASFYGVFELK